MLNDCYVTHNLRIMFSPKIGDFLQTKFGINICIYKFFFKLTGEVLFYEKGQHDAVWIENWINGQYDTQVEISKSVLNEYQDITVEVICKVHSMVAIPELFKEGIIIKFDFYFLARGHSQTTLISKGEGVIQMSTRLRRSKIL